MQYVGIAVDEPKRIPRLNVSVKYIQKVSLLVKYGYTEEMAKQKCIEYGLLSPIYQNGTRGGCWFCPNIRYETFARFKLVHPDLWDMLLQLGNTPNLTSYGFKYGKTIEYVNERIDAINNQGKLFEDERQ